MLILLYTNLSANLLWRVPLLDLALYNPIALHNTLHTCAKFQKNVRNNSILVHYGINQKRVFKVLSSFAESMQKREHNYTTCGGGRLPPTRSRPKIVFMLQKSEERTREKIIITLPIIKLKKLNRMRQFSPILLWSFTISWPCKPEYWYVQAYTLKANCYKYCTCNITF